MCVSIMKVENFLDGTCVRACMCVSIMVGENFLDGASNILNLQTKDHETCSCSSKHM